MAAILGALRNFLVDMPFLRAFTKQMFHFVQLHQVKCWNHPLNFPPSLQEEVRQLNILTQTWKGRPFQGQVAVRHLHSDSSQVGWGVDIHTGNVVQEFWRGQDVLHINVKEPQASINTVRSLAREG